MVGEAVGRDSSKDRDYISSHIQKTERELDVGRCNKLSNLSLFAYFLQQGFKTYEFHNLINQHHLGY
jgi:hypothetical protein